MTRALIAIDATSVPPRPAGAGRYAIELIHALGGVDEAHDYVVYCRSHSLSLLSPLPSHMTLVDVGRLSRGRRYVWEQTRLPLDLRRRGVDLLHSTHHSLPFAYSPCRRVVTVHDVTFFLAPARYPPLRRVFFQLMTRLSARFADAIIVPSRSAAADLQWTLHPHSGRVHVTYEGVAPEFHPVPPHEAAIVARRYGLEPGYLLSLGTREPGKNRSTLLRAIERLRSEGRDVHLAVVGQHSWGQDDEASPALRDRVRFTGYVDQSDLPALYSAASALVFPSLHEGFGLPVLESMACGTPVVTSNRSAMPEVASDAALLVDPRDERAIADAIASLLDDDALRARLRDAGIERASSFTWDECARATVAVYDEVLSR